MRRMILSDQEFLTFIFGLVVGRICSLHKEMLTAFGV